MPAQFLFKMHLWQLREHQFQHLDVVRDGYRGVLPPLFQSIAHHLLQHLVKVEGEF